MLKSSAVALGDKLSISFSMLCVIHCLATPVLLVVLPTVFSMHLEGEGFHLFLSAIVIPLSALTLFLGCRHHRTWRVAIVGVLGVAMLGSAALFGHDLVGESGEKFATVLSASVIAVAHIWNYSLCNKNDKSGADCDCTAVE